MKTDMYVELDGNQVACKQLVEKAKEVWKESGGKVKDLTHLDLYYKPQENACYYVMNDDMKGDFQV